MKVFGVCILVALCLVVEGHLELGRDYGSTSGPKVTNNGQDFKLIKFAKTLSRYRIDGAETWSFYGGPDFINGKALHTAKGPKGWTGVPGPLNDKLNSAKMVEGKCWLENTYWNGPGCCSKQDIKVLSREDCYKRCNAEPNCRKVTYWEFGTEKHCRTHSNMNLPKLAGNIKHANQPKGALANKVWAAIKGCKDTHPLCSAGKYTSGGKCVACPSGKICAGGVGGVAKACGAGKVCSGGVEKACGAGKVCTGGIEKACGAGKLCTGGVEKACGAGKVCSGGAEKACGAGKLCTGGVEKACPADNLCANGAAKACFGGSKRASGASKCTKTVECTTAKCTC